MSLEQKRIRKFADKLRSDEVEVEKKNAILQLFLNNDVSIDQLKETKVGKIVKKLQFESGITGRLATQVFDKWEKMVSDFCKKQKLKEKSSETLKSTTVLSFIDKNNNSEHKAPVNQLDTSVNFNSTPVKQIRLADNFFDLNFNNKTNDNQEKSPQDNIVDDKESQNKSSEQDDVDTTSRFNSKLVRWNPNKKTDGSSVSIPEETINGISVSLIKHYSWRKLIEIEAGDKKLMKQTARFWRDLFIKNFPSEQRLNDKETYRDAYLRIQKEKDRKFQSLTAHLRDKRQQEQIAQKQTKIIPMPIKMNLKRRRR